MILSSLALIICSRVDSDDDITVVLPSPCWCVSYQEEANKLDITIRLAILREEYELPTGFEGIRKENEERRRRLNDQIRKNHQRKIEQEFSQNICCSSANASIVCIRPRNSIVHGRVISKPFVLLFFPPYRSAFAPS